MSDPIVGPAILLVTEVLKFINTQESNKYSKRLVEIELDLNDELAKDYDKQNDKKIVKLRKERAIIIRAAHAEFLMMIAAMKK